MAKPLISIEAIYTRALALLDEEGAEALTTRRLASELGISTRTLYQRVGSREELIRALVAHHFSQLRLDFHQLHDWESTAFQWCLSLRTALHAHPFLTELMTVDDRTAVMDYVGELVEATLRAGIPRETALECCRVLVNVTINHSVMEVRAMREPRLSRDQAALSAFDQAKSLTIDKGFPMAIRWLIAGVRAEASLAAMTGVTTENPARLAQPQPRMSGAIGRPLSR